MNVLAWSRAFALLPAPRRVRGLLKPNASFGMPALHRCDGCIHYFALEGDVSAVCPMCAYPVYPPWQKHGVMKPPRKARAHESEAWRGGLRAGAGALVGAAALAIEDDRDDLV